MQMQSLKLLGLEYAASRTLRPLFLCHSHLTTVQNCIFPPNPKSRVYPERHKTLIKLVVHVQGAPR